MPDLPTEPAEFPKISKSTFFFFLVDTHQHPLGAGLVYIRLFLLLKKFLKFIPHDFIRETSNGNNGCMSVHNLWHKEYDYLHMYKPKFSSVPSCREVLIHIFYKQLHFPSQPGVASEILEKKAESCLAVAYPTKINLHEIKRNRCFSGKLLDFRQISGWQLLSSCLIFGQNLRLGAKQPSCL